MPASDALTTPGSRGSYELGVGLPVRVVEVWLRSVAMAEVKRMTSLKISSRHHSHGSGNPGHGFLLSQSLPPA